MANPNNLWSWILTDQAKTALAGAAGGIVRWVTRRERWQDGAASLLVGSICALYVGPFVNPLALIEAAAVRMALTVSGAEVVPVLQTQAEVADTWALREQAKAGGSVVGGGGGVTLADLPNWSLGLVGIATLIAIFIFIGNRRHGRDRTEAYCNASLVAKT